MSVIMIGGEPATGKTTLVSRVIEDLCNPINIDPLPLFPCQQHDDVLVVGRYAPGKTFNGTDGLSYSAIPKFRQFIEQEYMKHKHIICEGDRFFRMKDIEWLVSGYFDAQIYVIHASPNVLEERHKKRGDTQGQTWLSGRRTQIRNICSNLQLQDAIKIRSNENPESSDALVREISDLVRPTQESSHRTVGQQVRAIEHH